MLVFARTQSQLNSDFRLQTGFSLIELMIAVAVMAVILSVAIPSFQAFSLSSKLRSYATSLSASALLARSEAIKRSKSVTLCASSNGLTCGGNWEQGWVVLLDGSVLYRQQALPAGYWVTSGGVSSIIFPPTGVGVVQSSLRICGSSPNTDSQGRDVTISPTGRSKVTPTSEGGCSAG